MKKLMFCLVMLPVVAMMSCSKDDDKGVNYASEIVGTWRHLYSDGIVVTNNETATAIIKDAFMKIGAEGPRNITFTADKKYLEESVESGTYSVQGNKLTITRTGGERHTMELQTEKPILHIIEDVKGQFQSSDFGYENLVITTLKIDSSYSKVQ